MKPVPILLLAVGFSLALAFAERDPFWPLGFDPKNLQPTPVPHQANQEPQPTPEVVRELSDAELAALAKEEARRISESFTRGGTAIMNNRIYAHVKGENITTQTNSNWVTAGDYFFITLHGKRYRMDVVRLTKTRIQLEPYRVSDEP